MANEHAKPGDRIVVTRKPFVGVEFTVVECPEEKRGGPYWDAAYVIHNDSTTAIPNTCDYDIISRSKTSVTGQNNGAVDEFLETQRDDNLREVFS